MKTILILKWLYILTRNQGIEKHKLHSFVVRDPFPFHVRDSCERTQKQIQTVVTCMFLKLQSVYKVLYITMYSVSVCTCYPMELSHHVNQMIRLLRQGNQSLLSPFKSKGTHNSSNQISRTSFRCFLDAFDQHSILILCQN